MHLHLGRDPVFHVADGDLGGSAVENFAIPMVFGVVIATTSSIFIAAPILLLLGDWWQHRNAGRVETIEA